MTQYFEVTFNFLNHEEQTIHVDRLGDVTEGFWITLTGKFTKCSDCKYFILPHQISRITRRELPDKGVNEDD